MPGSASSLAALLMMMATGCDGGNAIRPVAGDFAVATMDAGHDLNGRDGAFDASIGDAGSTDDAAVCTAGTTICSGVCTNLSSDNANCNGCGNACAAGSACIGYQCIACNPKTCEQIGATCGAISDGCGHPLDCGTCSPIAVCSSNNCVCALSCGASCVDKRSDPQNCGGCGAVCASGNCVAGACGPPLECKVRNPNVGFKVLFYGPIGTAEQPFIPGATPAVTVWDELTWRSKTTTDFKAFDLIVIGESPGGCPSDPAVYGAALDSASQWGPAVGRVIVSELDAAKLGAAGNLSARTLLTNTLQWLALGPGPGLYVGPDCGARHLDFMGRFAPAFHSLAATSDAILVSDPAHPAMAAMSGASLSNWMSSAVGQIDVAPTAANWEVLAGANMGAVPPAVLVARNLVCPCAGPKLPTEVLGSASGCAGAVGFANRLTLCGVGAHVCSASEWMSQRRGAVPAHDYWTNDVLNFAGTGTSSCEVSTSTSVGGVTYLTSCSAQPMHVCGASPDPEGNTCQWLHSGYQSLAPDLYFGGCATDPTAGALCCQ